MVIDSNVTICTYNFQTIFQTVILQFFNHFHSHALTFYTLVMWGKMLATTIQLSPISFYIFTSASNSSLVPSCSLGGI